jgi:hypothetical protein
MYIARFVPLRNILINLGKQGPHEKELENYIEQMFEFEHMKLLCSRPLDFLTGGRQLLD